MRIFEKERHLRHRVIRIFGLKVFSYSVRHARRIVASEGNKVSNIPPHCGVVISGRGNRVVFREPVDEMFCGEVRIGSPDSPANGCVVEIGAGTTSNGCEIRLMEDGSRCEIGADCMFSDGVRIWGSDTHAVLCEGRLNLGKAVTIGEYTGIGRDVDISATSIGRYCSIGSHIRIGQGEHDLGQVSTSGVLSTGNAELSALRCEIGHDVWIGTEAVIRRGVKIGNFAVIGANAFVNKDVPDFGIAVGIPARVVRLRFTPEQRKKIVDSKYWLLPPEEAKAVIRKLGI